MVDQGIKSRFEEINGDGRCSITKLWLGVEVNKQRLIRQVARRQKAVPVFDIASHKYIQSRTFATL
jgi:hypothetical protein